MLTDEHHLDPEEEKGGFISGGKFCIYVHGTNIKYCVQIKLDQRVVFWAKFGSVEAISKLWIVICLPLAAPRLNKLSWLG